MNNEKFTQVFKFCSIDVDSIGSLKKSYIWFCSKKKLNDPLDSLPNTIPLLQKEFYKQYKRLNGSEIRSLLDMKIREIDNEIKKVSSSVGIFSATTGLLNSQLWSHYGNEHKGMALLYEFPFDFLNDPEKFILCAEVDYGSDKLCIDIQKYAEQFSPGRRIDEDKVMEVSGNFGNRILLIKDEGWSYENEYRIISNEPGKCEIDRCYVKQITFGLETPSDDIKKVRLITDEYYPDVILAKIKRATDSALGLDVVLL